MSPRPKNKDYKTNNSNNNQEIKAMGNTTPSMDYYPKNRCMEKTDP